MSTSTVLEEILHALSSNNHKCFCSTSPILCFMILNILIYDTNLEIIFSFFWKIIKFSNKTYTEIYFHECCMCTRLFFSSSFSFLLLHVSGSSCIAHNSSFSCASVAFIFTKLLNFSQEIDPESSLIY